jgi:hypothetical protein
MTNFEIKLFKNCAFGEAKQGEIAGAKNHPQAGEKNVARATFEG